MRAVSLSRVYVGGSTQLGTYLPRYLSRRGSCHQIRNRCSLLCKFFFFKKRNTREKNLYILIVNKRKTAAYKVFRSHNKKANKQTPML